MGTGRGGPPQDGLAWALTCNTSCNIGVTGPAEELHSAWPETPFVASPSQSSAGKAPDANRPEV